MDLPRRRLDPLAKTSHTSNASNVRGASNFQFRCASQTNSFAYEPADVSHGTVQQDASHAHLRKLWESGSEGLQVPLQRIKVSVELCHFSSVDLCCMSYDCGWVIFCYMIWPSSRTTTLAIAQQATSLFPVICCWPTLLQAGDCFEY